MKWKPLIQVWFSLHIYAPNQQVINAWSVVTGDRIHLSRLFNVYWFPKGENWFRIEMAGTFGNGRTIGVPSFCNEYKSLQVLQFDVNAQQCE